MRRGHYLRLGRPVIVAVLCAAAQAQTSAPVIKTQGFLPFANAPIDYRSHQLNDPIAKLQRRLDAGEITLHYDPKFGYLPSVLEALRIPVSSQTLVFSKTSFQFRQIDPAHPRSLYFNDDVYVGRVLNAGFLEFVSFDPMQGAVFYIMDVRKTAHPVFERSAVDCVQCHVAKSTRGVPGVMLRSVSTRPSGYQATGGAAFITGQESPMQERWGGWYVTAASGAGQHLGNFTVPDGSNSGQAVGLVDLPSLKGLIDTAPYPADTSDVVALMVLAHQTQMHNLITEVNYRTRLAEYAKAQKPDAPDATPQIEALSEELLQYLLFTNEAPLASPVVGSSSFRRDFEARGPRDAKGRSLRDFDLQKRIFKYPCSYLIYSDDFNALPEPALSYINRRLLEVLSGQDHSPPFARLSSEDRRAILEILAATKPDFAEQWKQFVQKGTHE